VEVDVEDGALMGESFASWLTIGCLALAVTGCIYALGAAVVVRRFAEEGVLPPVTYPGVTILKPLHGVGPGLYDDLVSFCDQDYPGRVQILFGAQDAGDAAIAVVKRLIAERPGRDLELVLQHTPTLGPNPKIANLVGLQRHIRHEVVILADADIAVARDYLRKTTSVLDLPGVGAVTYLYRGVPRGAIWGHLASMGIDYYFLPNVLVGLKLHLARPCFGSTIALRRETLAAIGGFDAFLDYIADDNAIGEAVRATGMKVAIPSILLGHACSERSVGELLRHELRWARTVRAVNPLGYAGSVVTYPLPFAVVGAAASGFGLLGMAMIAVAIFCRLVLQLQVDHTLGVPADRWWLGPARDLLAFGIHVASYFVSIVSWRGRRYRVRSDGTLVAIGEPKA
jgi:ceramide glucosyltransferase